MSIKGKSKSRITIEEPEELKIGIVQAQWNQEITNQMATECRKALLDYGLKEENIFHEMVPGSFELPLGALLIENSIQPDAVICLGCVIKGETDHDVFINQGITNAIMGMNIRYGKPFVFGVLTVNSEEQAIARADGSKENKGNEAAEVALEMISLGMKLEKENKQVIGFKPYVKI